MFCFFYENVQIQLQMCEFLLLIREIFGGGASVQHCIYYKHPPFVQTYHLLATPFVRDKLFDPGPEFLSFLFGVPDTPRTVPHVLH